MKRETQTHPKLHDLALRLGIDRPHALGLLQHLIWFTADHAIGGNVGKWSDEAIAGGCGWTGRPAEFIDALVAAGWLDLDAKHRLLLHDWPAHAENWVRAKMKKIGERFCEATPLAPELGLPGDNGQNRTLERTEPHLRADRTALESGQNRTSVPTTNRTEPNRTEPNQGGAQKRATCVAPPVEWGEAFAQTWQAWFDHRGERRRSRSEPHQRRTLERLRALTPAARIACLQYSIDNDYAGLFPERFDNTTKNGQGGAANARSNAKRIT